MIAFHLYKLFLLGLLLSVAWVAPVVTANDEDAPPAEESAPNNSAENTAAVPAVVASIKIKLEKQSPTAEDTTPEEDKEEQCGEWAIAKECHLNPQYMLANCATSCHAMKLQQTTKFANAVVYEGEDAAVGAFRFAEEYLTDGNLNVLEEQEKTMTIIVDVARQLQSELDSSADNKYTPPSDLTHCGASGNKKARLCSAGKLWKRAEEMRKADMHDAAGADLIRALLKSGIEIDFIDKCKRSLKWAMGSVQRQREREAKEAIEEAKLEQRREEERKAMDEAIERKKEYEADFVKFGTQIQELVANGGASASVGADGTVEEQPSKELILQIQQTFVAEGPQGANWNDTLQLLKKIPPSDKTVEVLLIEARCQDMMGNHKGALSAAGRLISKAASYDPWINDSPRMMAATLGANAAMQLGLSDNALSFYQTVLKFDPEQERARKQYRGLKKVVKLMNKAEEQIQKGYNKAAAEIVDDCLSAMRGLDVDSPLFRSKIQLKQCTILSAMGKYEEALANCDSAVELRLSNDAVSIESRKEAHLARAEALLLDMDYDEAVQDFRAAFDLVPDDEHNRDEKRELNHKLQSTQRQQSMWNGGQKDHRFNEHTGYPDGMPPQRDHAKILQLPIDLEERSKDIKCAWLRKQFKSLVRKFHPDKYKGNKKRAARKFKEVKEAKEILSTSWGC